MSGNDHRGGLWAWSERAMADAELRRAALALQDGFAINANLALWSVWTARAGFGLTDDQAGQVAAVIGPMDAYVVRRLREVRRYLSSPRPGYAEADLAALQREAFEAELAAERLVQHRLEHETRKRGAEGAPREGEQAREEAKRLFSLCRAHLENRVALADDLGDGSPSALFERIWQASPRLSGDDTASGTR